MAKTFRHDEALDQILEEHKILGEGWELKFIDTFYSFVRRKTDLLDTSKGLKRFQDRAQQHHNLADKKKKPKTRG